MRERDLLHHIYRQHGTLPEGITLGPGDDMGGVRARGEMLVTVDQVADGVHFDLRQATLARVARKAVTRNLSDVAAMAALPVAAVAAASLPRDFGQRQATDLCDLMHTTGSRYGCPIIGGDISIWDHPLLITVTVLAARSGIRPVLRSGARPGDSIFVTGRLGGSLQTIDGYTHHLDFEPRLELARTLAGDPALRPSCMIDLSDGLAQDLPRLCEASGVAAILEIPRLPISPAAHVAADASGRDPWWHALGDGEDYELCFALRPRQVAQGVPRKLRGVPITKIGTFVAAQDGPLVQLRTADGMLEPMSESGWEHTGREPGREGSA